MIMFLIIFLNLIVWKTMDKRKPIKPPKRKTTTKIKTTTKRKTTQLRKPLCSRKHSMQKKHSLKRCFYGHHVYQDDFPSSPRNFEKELQTYLEKWKIVLDKLVNSVKTNKMDQLIVQKLSETYKSILEATKSDNMTPDQYDKHNATLSNQVLATFENLRKRPLNFFEMVRKNTMSKSLNTLEEEFSNIS